MEYKEEKTKQIDVVAIAKTMWQHKKAYIIALPVVAVVSYLLIVCVPRTYTSTVKLAPELSSFNSSSLSDIASSFGKTCISHLSCAYIIMCKNIKNMAIKQIYLDYFIKRT